MADLRLYDSLERKIKPVRPRDGKRLRFYLCGPTVYAPSHIGNLRTFLINDVLFRIMKVAGLNPLFVRNITDVDDKTIRDSQEAGQPLRAFTEKWTQQLHEDCRILNMLPPDHEPRATDHIQEQVQLIQTLMEKGHAYRAEDGSVYFKVASFAEYGKLSHFELDALQSQGQTSGGSPNLSDEYAREQVADFALWKSHKPADGDNAWDSPWGRGRPGWHVECSAMSMKYLGESFDLHTGGEDLRFPHHENEIAQSESATGKQFASHWMHTTHLLVDGRKMSKSEGNFYTLQDLLGKGVTPMTIRLALISGHYRKQLNFTLHSLDAARSALDKLARAAGDLGPDAPPSGDMGPFGEAWEHLLNDLNTAAALGSLFSHLRDYDSNDPEHRNGLRSLLYVLGLKTDDPGSRLRPEPDENIRKLADTRWQAKQDRDFASADRLRDELMELGWAVRDRKDGYDLEPAS